MQTYRIWKITLLMLAATVIASFCSINAAALDDAGENETAEITDAGTSLSHKSIDSGEIFTIISDFTGGDGDYDYSYGYICLQNGKEYSTSYIKNQKYSFKMPKTAANYNFYVKVKDQSGKQSMFREKGDVEQATGKELAIKASVDADKTYIGQSISVTANPSGGTAPYTYSYYYKRHFNNNWKPIKENTTSTSARLTPTVADDYDLKITVKDSEGAEAEAYYMVRVVNALENMSVLSADSIKIGEALTVTGAAQGGSDPYTYSYYVKNVNDKEWTVIHENVYTAATVSARTAGSYEVKVIVTDSRGKTAEKILGFTAKNNTRMINTSVINSNIVQVGDKVRLAASANGGTAPYKFAYYYKRSSNNNWKVLGTEFGTNSSVAFAPTAETDYDVKIIVKDADGETSEKTFTVTAVKELELTNVSTINRNTVNLGSAVKMTAKAVGGTGPYTYAFYFKRATNTIWKTVGTAFTDTATAKIKPTAAADYQFRIVVQDSTGAKATKEFTVKAF